MCRAIVGRDVEHQNLSLIAGGSANGIATLEDILTVPTKLNTVLPYDLEIALLGRNQTDLKIYLHMFSFISNCPNL